MMSKSTTSKAFVLDQQASTASSSNQSQEPAQGKGKGKCRSHNRWSQSAPQNGQFSQKGKGEGGKASQLEYPPDKFKARITCKFCGKPNHCESECWTKEKVERKQKAEAKSNQQGRMPQAERSQTSQNPKMTDDSNQKKRKIAEINFLKAFYLDTTILGQKLDSIIDTGASISAVSSKFTRTSHINPTEAQAIRVGNGDLMHSLGTTEVEVHIGPSLKLLQKCHVLETNAFDCVLGLDFLESQPVNGLLLKPARLIVQNQEFPLREEGARSRVFRIFPCEDYKLKSEIRASALEKLGVLPSSIDVDLFASEKNKQEPLFCSKGNSCWSYHWGRLTKNPSDYLWTNPLSQNWPEQSPKLHWRRLELS